MTMGTSVSMARSTMPMLSSWYFYSSACILHRATRSSADDQHDSYTRCSPMYATIGHIQTYTVNFTEAVQFLVCCESRVDE